MVPSGVGIVAVRVAYVDDDECAMDGSLELPPTPPLASSTNADFSAKLPLLPGPDSPVQPPSQPPATSSSLRDADLQEPAQPHFVGLDLQLRHTAQEASSQPFPGTFSAERTRTTRQRPTGRRVLNPDATTASRSDTNQPTSSEVHYPRPAAGDDVHPGAARPRVRPHPHGRRRASPGPPAHRLHPLRARLRARGGPGAAPGPGGGPGDRRRGPLLLQRARHRLGRRLPLAAPGARRRVPPSRRRPPRPPHAHRRRRHGPRRGRRAPPRALPRLPPHARRPRRALHERGRHGPPAPALRRAPAPRQDHPRACAPGRRAAREEAQGAGGQGDGGRRRRLRRRARDRRRGRQVRRAARGQEVGRRRVRVHQGLHVPRCVQGRRDCRGERRGEEQALRFQTLIRTQMGECLWSLKSLLVFCDCTLINRR